MDILERLQKGELIRHDDPNYHKVQERIDWIFTKTIELNKSSHDPQVIREKIGEMLGITVDESTTICIPFYTDWGRSIGIGKNVFINMGCTFMDRGGIIIEDKALIGPNVSLITENHPENPVDRHYVYSKPILIKEGAWLGANSTILPGITIGRNAIVGAGSIVTKDVPDDTIVAGNPARVIRKIQIK